MKNFQSFNDDKVQVQTVDFGSLTMCRGDVVMTLHMITFPTSSDIGVDDDDYCDTRKMRVMISELIIDKTGSSDATESDGVQDDLEITTDTTRSVTESTADPAGGATESTS